MRPPRQAQFRIAQLAALACVAAGAASADTTADRETEALVAHARARLVQAGTDGTPLHAEVKRRGSPCRLRIVTHPGRLEAHDVADGAIDLDMARLAPGDFAVVDRIVDGDGIARPVVQFAPARPEAVTLASVERSPRLGTKAFPSLYVMARAAAAPIRDRDVRRELERRAADDLAAALGALATACRAAETG
jgi:hypothetical protein